jgi:hypothetical protein
MPVQKLKASSKVPEKTLAKRTHKDETEDKKWRKEDSSANRKRTVGHKRDDRRD